MSRYYFLGCDKCETHVPFWARYVGGPSCIPTAREFPYTVQNFINDHEQHGIVVYSEHDSRSFGYTDALDNYPEINKD